MSRKVYLFRAAQFFKIGISGNISKRLLSLQTGCPIKCEYIGYFPTSEPERLEKELHLKFNGFLTYGEWFDLGDHNIKILITEFSLKYVTNPFTAITQEQEVIANAPALKKVRESSADIQEITLLYEELYPGHTFTDNGKIDIRKYVSKYGKQAVVESLYKLSERFDEDDVLEKLPYAARSFHSYGRHINDITWKAYYRVLADYSIDVARKFLVFIMKNNLDNQPDLDFILDDLYNSSPIDGSIDEWLNNHLELREYLESYNKTT